MRTGIIVSHPIQYYTPWYQMLAARSDIDLKVFYLWNFGVKEVADPDFGKKISWDIPLLEGYDSIFIENKSPKPGTNHFRGLNNPSLIQTVRDWKPDLLLLYGYNAQSLMQVLFSSEIKNIPKILRGDSHRLFEKKGLKNKIRKLLISYIFRRFKAALYVGDANRSYLSQHGFKDNELFFAPHAVDKSRFYPDEQKALSIRKDWGVSENDCVLLFAGKFEEKKCPVKLLEQFLKNAPLNYKLVLVGSGNQEQEMRGIAEKDKRVIFLGFQNQSTMPNIYRGCDAVVLPSYGSGETWGLCIQEAMDCGRAAIVSSHVGCAQDLVKHSQSGYIFPAGDWEGLGKLLSQLPNERKKLLDMGQMALKNVANYSYETATQGLLAAAEFVKK